MAAKRQGEMMMLHIDWSDNVDLVIFTEHFSLDQASLMTIMTIFLIE